MDIEESSGPYRGFRSGSYPAITKRIVDGGGVLLRASSWFALVVTAASAGFNMTQRLVSDSAAAPELVAKAALQPRVTPMAIAQVPKPRVASLEQRAAAPQERNSSDASAQRANPPVASTPTGSVALASVASVVTVVSKDKQRSGAAPHKHNDSAAASHAQHTLPTAAIPDVEASASEDASRRSELIAERVRELDAVSRRDSEHDLTVKESVTQTITEARPASAAKSSAAVEITVDADSQPSLPSTVAATSSTLTTTATRPMLRPTIAPQLPTVIHIKPAQRAEPTLQLPLAAAVRIEGLAVNGSVSSANVRHGLERVQPALTECYAQAAQRAGKNRFSQVRAMVVIDEAGRVKTPPAIEGAELPGFEGCLSSAFSKLVCRAPDTGTAKASITVQFSAASRVEMR